jgi:DNA-binding NarL/FixJ family response regulator
VIVLSDPPFAPAPGLPSEPLHVAVVSRDPELERQVAELLEREGLVARVATAGSQRLATAQLPWAPQIVVLGPSADHDARQVRRIACSLGRPRVIVVLRPSAAAEVRALLDAGLCGVVGEEHVERTLALTIRSVAEGLVALPHELRPAMNVPALSHRERQILSLVSAGLTNDEIGSRLHLAESTVKGHLTSAFRRLGVHSRREAVALILAADEALRRSVLTAAGSAERIQQRRDDDAKRSRAGAEGRTTPVREPRHPRQG